MSWNRKGVQISMFDLSSWAAIAEIVGTVAVVFSLLLVAYSIKRNTDEMETANSNFLYQLDAEITGDLSRDVRLATILLKMEQKEALTGVEKIQYVALQERYLGVLEIAWTQYKSGSLAFIDWRDWDKYLSDFVTDDLPKEWWNELRSRYKPEFADHVDSKYVEN
jgi:hypothetical protein